MKRNLKGEPNSWLYGVIKLTDVLPNTTTGNVIGKQILRSATSVGANYRAVCRARSEADMIAKLGIVEEEGDGN